MSVKKILVGKLEYRQIFSDNRILIPVFQLGKLSHTPDFDMVFPIWKIFFNKKLQILFFGFGKFSLTPGFWYYFSDLENCLGHQVLTTVFPIWKMLSNAVFFIQFSRVGKLFMILDFLYLQLFQLRKLCLPNFLCLQFFQLRKFSLTPNFQYSFTLRPYTPGPTDKKLICMLCKQSLPDEKRPLLILSISVHFSIKEFCIFPFNSSHFSTMLLC